MDAFSVFAEPWWVNVLILAPLIAFAAFREKKIALTSQKLLLAALFGVAFGFAEAAVVIYIRAALGMVAVPSFQAIQVVNGIPKSLFAVELFREAATMIMLVSVALLAGREPRARWAIFLFAFAVWDIFYYLFLWLVIGWPPSLTTTDVLFLIPTPWYAQVWFPILVSFLMIVAVIANRRIESA